MQLERVREFEVLKDVTEAIDMLYVVTLVCKACKGWLMGRNARSGPAASNVSAALIKAAMCSDAKFRGRRGILDIFFKIR